jgi:hypothetical protein
MYKTGCPMQQASSIMPGFKSENKQITGFCKENYD